MNHLCEQGGRPHCTDGDPQLAILRVLGYDSSLSRVEQPVPAGTLAISDSFPCPFRDAWREPIMLLSHKQMVRLCQTEHWWKRWRCQCGRGNYGWRMIKSIGRSHARGFPQGPFPQNNSRIQEIHSTIIIPQGFERQMPAEPETQPLMVESAAFLPRSLLIKVSVTQIIARESHQAEQINTKV